MDARRVPDRRVARLPNTLRRLPVRLLAAASAAVVGLSACGGAIKTRTAPSAPSAATPTASKQSAPPAIAELAAAERPRTGEFPAVAGRSLSQLALLAGGTAQLGAATATFTPGIRRLAFALTDRSQRFIYAPTAIYLAPTPNSTAEGPFLAPADPMEVSPPIPQPAERRARRDPGDLLDRGPGRTLARLRHPRAHPRGGTADRLDRRDRGRDLHADPCVGQRPPAISTETLASVGGNVGLLTTRLPPESMHSVAFNQVLGKRPVALLFSTPELCTSKVCGPVTDIVVQLQHEFGNRIVFIHQEIYVDNQPTRGLRPQLQAFHIETEPWLFTIDRRGVIAARLEGAFGLAEARLAIEAALR